MKVVPLGVKQFKNGDVIAKLEISDENGLIFSANLYSINGR